MLNYIVKKDGFILGTAKGKAKAISNLKRHLEFNGIIHLAKWYKSKGMIIARVNHWCDEEYTIEQDKGEK